MEAALPLPTLAEPPPDGAPAWARWAAYLRGAPAVGGRTGFECALAAALLDEAPDRSLTAEPPPDLARRASGAVLCWVASQRQHRPVGPPERLLAGPSLTRREAVLAARAWACWPQNPALDAALRARLRTRLESTPAALGWVAVVLAARDAPEAASACAERWLRRAVRGPGEEALVTALLRHPGVRSAGVRALRRLLVLRRGDGACVERLAHAAYEAGCYPEVLAATQSLPARRCTALDALAVAALAHRGAGAEAVARYRAGWYPAAAPFPYPVPLLPPLYAHGERALLEHLLKHHTLPPGAAEWHRTWILAERRDAEGRWEASLPAWFQLFTEAPGTAQRARRGYFLLRLTHTLLAAPPEVRRAHEERFGLDVAAVWRRLRPENPATAEAALLLLEPGTQARLERYRRHLAAVPPPGNRLVQRARRAYLEALVQGRYWDELHALLEQQGALATLCTPDEQYLMHALIDAEAVVRAEPLDPEGWCGRWEVLLGLRLPEPFVLAALDQFARLRRRLRSRGHPLARHPAFLDVALQQERRGKALGERILAEVALARPDADAWRGRLDRATLDGLPELLRELRQRFGREGDG